MRSGEREVVRVEARVLEGIPEDATRSEQDSTWEGEETEKGKSVPAVPSKGRWETSSVARSRRSSRIRTSMGPEKEARMAVGPEERETQQRARTSEQDSRQGASQARQRKGREEIYEVSSRFSSTPQRRAGHAPMLTLALPSARESVPKRTSNARCSVAERPSGRDDNEEDEVSTSIVSD